MFFRIKINQHAKPIIKLSIPALRKSWSAQPCHTLPQRLGTLNAELCATSQKKSCSLHGTNIFITHHDSQPHPAALNTNFA